MMINLDVFKNIYYNTKSAEKDLELKAPVQIRYLDHKQNVDINELLNRVKIEEKNKIKNKLFFLIVAALPISFIGILLIFI
tara:strand:+ start:242 stop:484 length:243 start_codon:yes stop_codon:yes gene_type:complete